MRYIDSLITESRTDTNNTDFSSTSGINTEDFVRYLNFGQERLQSLILQQNPLTFQKEIVINVVAGQREYVIPDNVFMGERIVNVEYTSTGDDRNYFKITELGLSFRTNYPSNYASHYIRRNGAIILQPEPLTSQAKLRVTYERQLDKLDLRRGTISAVSLAGSVVSSITVNIATVSTDSSGLLTKAEYICINNKNGGVLAYGIPINGYNVATGAITIDGGSFTLQSGESIPVGSYVTVGQYSTTHSKLKDICERYLICYCNWKIAGRDSTEGNKYKVISSELETIEAELIQNYQTADKDDSFIQIANPDLILLGN